ncbi:transcriptional regulator PpsR [Novosphingobium marinum]|uniref:Transcriptional regulator PpsR n=1 Tax=Novosphingobium marinum TaxID=1514948 RepID=A0A7Y9XXF6_9SPHN|nr:transcriptional regulator PpsR [Novosphingobium marinum]NYH96386.1 transcriptional regulator PpsR [Novosphingobium marinum]GGC34801.1 transcriptional regulator PpsR [Novosphingobium marinum]
MLSRKHSIEGKEPFGEAAELFDAIGADAATKLAMVAGDLSLILDETGKIVDGTANLSDFPELQDWIGRDWLDTVTVESRPKVMEMLAGARKGRTQHWRQINHIGSDGEVPVRYTLVTFGDGQRFIAFGRDMREMAELQQRLLQAQQSLERDYLRLRQLETRYRLLFELSAEPVLIVDAENYRIREANPSVHALLGAKPGSLTGDRLTGLFSRSSREPIIAFLGSVMASNSVSPIEVGRAGSEGNLTLTAAGFRQHGKQFLIVRLSSGTAPSPPVAGSTLRVLEAMPDAFVLADSELKIVTANLAFVELVEAASVDQISGRQLGDFIGRPGIDIDLITGQLAKHGFAQNVGTVIGAREGFDGEPVELSAVRAGDDDAYFGFVIRPVGRRLRDLPPNQQELPLSVEQLTELVGRMSLKDIVRESTDLIERLCIEAALTYTSNNRASAAEILGLSRQSLYSKLHRYGLANTVSEPD